MPRVSDIGPSPSPRPSEPSGPAPRSNEVATPGAPNALDGFLPGSRRVAGDALSVGKRNGGPAEVFLHPDGTFSLGQGAAGAGAAAMAPALYEAALASDAKNPYERLPTPAKVKAFTVLESCAKEGADRAVREMTPGETTMQLKSGTATLFLDLARAAAKPEDKKLREQVINRYLTIAEKEIHRSLRLSMTLNLDALRSELALSPEQTSRLDKLLALALPSKPPYEEWFKNGNTHLKIRHYMHEDFYEEDLRIYTGRNYRRTDLPDGRVVFEKTVKDPTGRYPDTTFTVETTKVAWGTDRAMLKEMNDPDVNIQVYTGHSELGGNIAQSLKAAPQTEVGSKLVYLGMCRGKQNVADFTNRFPRAHLITTAKPATAYGTDGMVEAILDTVVERGDYSVLAKKAPNRAYSGEGDHMLPNDPRMYSYRDLDADGKLDAGYRMDRVYDIYPRAPGQAAIDFLPGPPVDPAKVDGTNVLNAIGFANTLLTYHVEHGDRTSPITAKYTDNLIADGFYRSDSDEFLKVTPETKNGRTFLRVGVNSRYANQSEHALGMRVLYELNRYITVQEKGSLDADDKMRGLLLACEWLEYMEGPTSLADKLTLNIAKLYGWPEGISYFGVIRPAFLKDDHAYVSKEILTALKAEIGAKVGDGRAIS